MNTVVIIRTKVFVETFCSKFFVFKFTVSTFIVTSPITKLGFRTSSVLLPTLITFYKVYFFFFELELSGLWNVINFIRISIFKSWSFFHQLTQFTRRQILTAPHGPQLLVASILGKTDLTRWSFKLLPFLKLILGISVKTFWCCSSGASKMCNSSKMFLFLETG